MTTFALHQFSGLFGEPFSQTPARTWRKELKERSLLSLFEVLKNGLMSGLCVKALGGRSRASLEGFGGDVSHEASGQARLPTIDMLLSLPIR